MEDILRAIILGVIQGITEFFPISSSGHLIVVRELIGWEIEEEIAFDVALHLGTTVAVISFFWKQWVSMIVTITSWVKHPRGHMDDDRRAQKNLFLCLCLGSIPIAVVGLVFGNVIIDHVRSPLMVGVMLVVFAAVLFVAERISNMSRTMSDIKPWHALSIGLAQVAALVPGVSRSGVTMSVGLTLGFTKEDAAKFSFLLATPAIVGAGALKAVDLVADGVPSGDIVIIVVGIISSALVGWLSISFLLRLVQRQGYLVFILYRLIAGAFVLSYFRVDQYISGLF